MSLKTLFVIIIVVTNTAFDIIVYLRICCPSLDTAARCAEADARQAFSVRV